MTLTSHAFQLPDELMSVIVDWVGVEGLVLLSAVSTNWRAVVHSHPLFWRDIRLKALSSTALSFFHARLDRAQGRNINLAMQPLVGQPSRWRVKSIVLPAVTRHLSHIVTLVVTLKYDLYAAALDALNVPAPNLRRLDLGFFNCPRGSPAVLLEPSLFARSSPKLVSVSLSNIKFPLQRISAFETVESLHFYFKEPRLPLHGIFQQFPRLTALEVVVEDGCIGVESVPGDKIATRRLSSLQLCMSTSGYGPIFDRIPYLHAIPAVSCWQPHAEEARVLLGHLHGPLEMELRGPSPESGTVRITLNAPACARKRTFVEVDYELEDAAVPGVCLHAIAARVTTLRMAAQLAYTAPLFAELPACRALQVVLDDDVRLPLSSRQDMPAAPLRLPALATLTVKAVGSCVERISADDLSAYLTALVGRTGKRPALRLEYVSITGSLSSLSPAFDLE